MDRNISRLGLLYFSVCNRKAVLNPRNKVNIVKVVIRNNSSDKKLNFVVNDASMKGLKAPQQPKSPGTGLLLLTVPIATFCLGTWQVRRREWKLKILEDLDSKVSQPPIDMPEDLNRLSGMEYRKVKLRGKFDHKLEMYLGPKTLLENNAGHSSASGGLLSTDIKSRTGYLVVTPFILANSGQRILVNRGWVNTKLVAPNRRASGQVEDEVEFTGIVRENEKRGVFVGENLKSLRIFHYRDLKVMADMGETLPVYVDACEDCTVPGGPIGGQTNLNIRNEHLTYIITWYSLSAITFLMWLRSFMR